MQHSHTDVGFTHEQPIVLELHRRYLEMAMRLAEREAGAAPGERFYWTVEVCGVMEKWMKHASKAEKERLSRLCKAGLIEVCGMPWHFTPLADKVELQEAFGLVTRLREELGIEIDSAMNSDVNGQNWTVVEVMLDAGIKGYSAAINTHFGRAPLRRPNVFMWEGPSGRAIPTLNGPPYGFVGKLGIGGRDFSIFENKWLPRLEAHLIENKWPLPFIMLQSVHAFGDNAPPTPELLDYIRRWNFKGKLPKLTMGTPRTWWEKVAKHAHLLKRIRGDWTDFWNFGCLSTARDLASHRRARVALRDADALVSMLKDRGESIPASIAEYRADAWLHHTLWQEHTWTADCAAEAPLCEDAYSMSAQKAAYAYRARSLAKLMRRDALCVLAESEDRTKEGELVIANTLPWPRVVAGTVNPGVSFPRGSAGDKLAGLHFQERKDDIDPLDMEEVPDMPWKQYPEQVLLPTEVPALGCVRVARKALVTIKKESRELPQASTYENDYFLVRPDGTRGGLRSLVDKKTGKEWVDQNCPWSMNGWVNERLEPKGGCWARDELFSMDWGADTFEIPSGWRADWNAKRMGAERVVEERVVESPIGLHIIQWLDIPRRRRGMRQEVYLPKHANWIEFKSRWLMEYMPEPEAHYLVFPFSLEGAQSWVDLGGTAMRPGMDQLPGSCHDYFTAQNWVALEGANQSAILALPENPMVQFGGFQFGKARTEFALEHPWVLGWATANYWHCNFPSTQPGWIKTRYRLQFGGKLDEVAAERFGLEAAQERPLIVSM